MTQMQQYPKISFFRILADLAAQQTLPRFRQKLDVENKELEGFDPVTIADRKTESVLRQKIRATYPDHGIIGEEYGNENENADYVWVIDPIDGTRAFISGVPVWGTLVGCLYKGKAVAGMLAQPFTGELFTATGRGSYVERFSRDDGHPRSLNVSSVTQLDKAILYTTAPELYQGIEKTAFDRLNQKVKLTRYGTDCYAFAMLASGYIDLVVETGLKPYDICALIPIVEQAGGVISCWNGERAEKGGNIIAAATPQLHHQAIELLQSQTNND